MRGGFGMMPPSDERPTNGGRVLQRTLGYLSPYKLQLGAALVLVVLTAAAQAAGPALIGRAIDVYISQKDTNGLAATMLLLLAVYVGGFVGQVAQGFTIGWVGQHFIADLRARIFAKVQTLPLAYFDRNAAGDVMSRLVNDIQTLNQLIGQALTQVLLNAFSLIGIIIAMLLISPSLALASFTTLPVMLAATIYFARRSRRAYRRTRTAIGAVSSDLQEEIAGVKTAQAFNRTGENVRRFAQRNAANRDANVQAVALTSAFSPTIDILSNVATAIVAIYGGYLVVNNQIAVGVVVAFFLYVQQFFRPIQIISSIAQQIQGALAGAERIFALVDEPATLENKPGARPLPQITGRVAFENVRFTYDADQPQPHDVLHDINFVAEPGQTIAIVGQTGAGKSTLINLIPRFYDVSGGRVTIDGIDVRDVTLASLRVQIGYVLQETFLFSGTVSDNIRYGKLDATDAEIERAAQTVHADEFINNLPQGYQTKLGERGTGLSQGQRQLIAFARAVLSNPRILALDEATSSIDTRTEELIQSALKDVLRGRTAFVIAHRLSTVRDADVILVVEAGQIVERGTHTELLARGGAYAALYQRQFRDSPVAA